MKEILVWGDISQEFTRLDINPRCAYSGRGWSKDEEISVFQLTDNEFEILSNDPKDDWTEVPGCWRWCKGSILGLPDMRFIVNHHYMLGWKGENHQTHCYEHLLEYLCNEMGVSVESNIFALTMDLAKYNNLCLAQLFRKYQG